MKINFVKNCLQREITGTTNMNYIDMVTYYVGNSRYSTIHLQ